MARASSYIKGSRTRKANRAHLSLFKFIHVCSKQAKINYSSGTLIEYLKLFQAQRSSSTKLLFKRTLINSYAVQYTGIHMHSF